MYFEENGYKKMKLVRETQKILNDKTIAVTATAVLYRGSHWRSGKRTVFDFEVSDIQSLHHTDGVVVQDNNDIPIQCMQGKDDVFCR
jgi:aspartate-semialdehyde dehydrogenase